MNLPNILHNDVPIDKDETNNKIVFSKPIPKSFIQNPLTHIELGSKLGFIDTDNGIAVTGNRGYFLTGMGVKLNMALLQYSMDFLQLINYKLMQTPHTVNKELMAKITQLNEYDETLYKLENHDKYLIATSEQPLTGYFGNKHFNKIELPIKLGGISTCYRKEVGAHGKQTRGIFRVHQFEKVEQFCVVEPDKSWNMFHEMINTSKEFYDSLGISYRVVNIVSGALNNAASMKYDLEAWFPGSKFYGELVSCSNCLDYFSKRINTKIVNNNEYVHMLNSTLCANTRVICCLMETYQTEEGMIIPKVLRKYINGIDFVKFIY